MSAREEALQIFYFLEKQLLNLSIYPDPALLWHIHEGWIPLTPHLGTTDALVKYFSDICSHLDDKNTVQSEIEFSKAFDKMRQDLTISKLIRLNADLKSVELIQD